VTVIEHHGSRFAVTPSLAGDLTDEQLEIAQLAHTLGAKYARRSFKDHSASLSQWDELASCGLTALSLPEEYGGAGGMLELCLVSERLAAGGYPAAKLVIATAIAGSILGRHGNEAQRARWLPGIAAGSTRFCFAFTEPGAGSNARNLQTAAHRTADGWRIRGEKTYISALESSDAMLLVTREAETGGLAVFACPLPFEGVTSTQVNVQAPAFEFQWNVFFDDVELPNNALIGEAGGGGRVLFDGLNPERLLVAAQAVGVGTWCIEQAVAYAVERIVFDVPIGAHQAIQHPLAESYVGLHAAWALTERAARLYDAGKDADVASSGAKLAACDAGFAAADRSLQVFGGSGYTDETGMLQRFDYLRLLKSIPVARELVLNHLATAGLGLPRSY
jgi:alkylation response protein AidB-like acyl-CoA dehydrogenase